ncbi:MAG: hypothetical protein AB7V19_05835, partial [Candidatus Bipolaricaulia bacterium]
MSGAVLAAVVTASFLLFGNAVALFALARLRTTSIDRACVLIISLGLAPGIVALFLYVLFLAVPGTAPLVHVLLVSMAFAILALSSWRHIALLGAAYRDLLRPHRPRMLARAVAVGAIVILLSSVAIVAILLPIQSHDALIHAERGRMLAVDRSLVHFPLAEPLPNGACMSSSYPPGVPLLYAWTHFVQGSTARDHGVRMIAPYFALLTILTLWRWGERLRTGAGLFAAFALAALPVYLSQAAQNSVDAMRMFYVVASLYLVTVLAEHTRFSVALAGLAALSLGLAGFTHTLGFLALPSAGLFYLAFARRTGFWRRLLEGASFVGVGGFVAGFDLLRRMALFGNWKGPVLSIP